MRRDPIAILEQQGADSAAGTHPDPVRAHARVAVHVLPRRGLSHGRGSRCRAAHGTDAQLCGDAHLSNFGVFAAPDRRLVFSINDFDETLPGPFEWDVKRLAASIAVAGRDLGFDEAARRSVVMATVREYRQAMANFAAMRNLDVWYTRLDVAASGSSSGRLRST